MVFIFYFLLIETMEVFDIFQTIQSKEFVFILFKNGQVNVWTFSKPKYEWTKLKELSLFKSKESQLVSYVYDDSKHLLVWCEKRSATQFCICKVHLNFVDGNVFFEETKAILHNCLPMNIYTLSKGNFTFLPVSNKTLGLFIFWSADNEQMTVSLIVFHTT